MNWRCSPENSRRIKIHDSNSKTLKGVGVALGSLNMKSNTGTYYARFHIQQCQEVYILEIGVGVEEKVKHGENTKISVVIFFSVLLLSLFYEENINRVCFYPCSSSGFSDVLYETDFTWQYDVLCNTDTSKERFTPIPKPKFFAPNPDGIHFLRWCMYSQCKV